jgi:hypothetical protein
MNNKKSHKKYERYLWLEEKSVPLS